MIEFIRLDLNYGNLIENKKVNVQRLSLDEGVGVKADVISKNAKSLFNIRNDK